MEPTNKERAEWADRALQAFQITTGTDREDAFCDLLCNLMHLADAEGSDFAAELAKARMHYGAETTGKPSQTTPDDTYQGWSNRETWAVALHLGNERAAYDTCRAIAKDCQGNPHRLADRLESYVVPGYLRFGAAMTPMHSDLMEAAIARIDFSEIAKNFLED